MAETLVYAGIEQLRLSPSRPRGYIPKPSVRLQQRVSRHGVLEPIGARPLDTREYEILTNAPTWIAAGQAGIREVPVLVHHGLSDDEAASIVADHYEQDKQDPIEEARTLSGQLDIFGGPGARGAISRLAEQLGLSRSQVAHSLRLLSLPKDIQRMVSLGDLSPGQARPLISLSTPDQHQLALRIHAEKLSVRESERIARELRRIDLEPSKSHVGSVDADVQRLERKITELVGSPFQIRGDEAVFNFFGDVDVLQGLLRRLGYNEE